MDNLTVIKCDDGSCCCLSSRISVFAISLLGMGVSLPELLLAEACTSRLCPMRNYVETGRVVLLTLFQFANTLLLGGVIIENAFLVKLYVWCTFSFVILGLILSILDFLSQYEDGARISFVHFVPEVAFLFVLYRCLPIVDQYRRHLETITIHGAYITSSVS